MFKNFYKNKYNYKLSTITGLTLVELLVVISIFTIITGITIFNYGRFDSSVSTQNLADDIALTVRRAQGYAVGAHGINDVFNYGYGIHFGLDPSKSEYYGNNKSFILFTNINTSDSSYNYDGTSNSCGNPTLTNECLEVLSILSSDVISSITLTDNSGTVFPISLDSSFDILFKRPNPEPVFCYKSTATSNCNNAIYSVKIKLSSENNPDNLVNRYITISNTGQISVSIK
jgi:type II secretory pathway pseudopilin PulG